MIVNTKDFDCPTCRHHRFGSCDTWCDCGEAQEPDMSKLKLKAIDLSKMWNNELDLLCHKLESLIRMDDEDFNKSLGQFAHLDPPQSFRAGYMYAIELMRTSMRKESSNETRDSNQPST